MSGMIILGVPMFSGILDQIVAFDFLANVIFSDSRLAWPAQIATWLAIAVTITLTSLTILRRALAVLKWAVRGLNALLDAIDRLPAALKDRFWRIVAALGLYLYSLANNNLK